MSRAARPWSGCGRGADRYGLENLASLDRLPRRGATVVVGLIPYQQGSGGQARIFASW